MRKLFICCFIMVKMCCPLLVNAQKAYDVITYSATIYGNPAKLELADGYLLSSKATIYSRKGNQIFTANESEPDEKGELRLNYSKGTGIFKKNPGSWLSLKGLNNMDYPRKINAVYWDGKTLKKILLIQH